MIVVTTDSIPGYDVTAIMGEVCGVIARPHNAFADGIRELNGGLNPAVSQALANVREQAVIELVRAARKRGANAVIGMRYDNRDVSPAWAELCAYGTAVRVSSQTPHPPIPARGRSTVRAVQIEEVTGIVTPD
jgi:uncharacterized protein YbjQ (UPF0145 family)